MWSTTIIYWEEEPLRFPVLPTLQEEQTDVTVALLREMGGPGLSRGAGGRYFLVRKAHPEPCDADFLLVGGSGCPRGSSSIRCMEGGHKYHEL